MKETTTVAESASRVCYQTMEAHARGCIQRWLQELLESEVSEFSGACQGATARRARAAARRLPQCVRQAQEDGVNRASAGLRSALRRPPPESRRRWISRTSRSSSRTSRGRRVSCGCSRWCWATAATCGRAFVCIKICKRYYACTSRPSSGWAVCRARSFYDRMKSAVLGEGEDEHIVYNRSLLALAAHYGFSPRACKPYRAKTKGKVERP